MGNILWLFCGKATGGRCEQYRCHEPSEFQGLSKGAQRRKKLHSSGDTNKSTNHYLKPSQGGKG